MGGAAPRSGRPALPSTLGHLLSTVNQKGPRCGILNRCSGRDGGGDVTTEFGGAPAAGSGWTAGALLQLFREQDETTRATIATRSGLARSTIALRLDELIGAGLIGPAARAISTGGRPPITFSLAAESRLVAGADLGAGHLTVGLADLRGRMLGTTTRTGAISRGPEVTLADTADALDELLTAQGRSRADVLAVGVGLPGPVEHSSGRARRPPIMPGWDGFDVPAWIARETGISAFVDNDVNLMAIGERHAARPEVADLVYVKVSTGIGAGIVSGGRLQRGALGAAGDLGHLAVPGAEQVPCTCGNTGCLEAIASAPVLIRALGLESGSQIAELVQAQDPEAIAAVREAGRSIGAVLASVVSLLNPSVVVLGGQLAEAGDVLLAGIREIVYRRATPLATEHLEIVSSRTGQTAGVLGAVRLALDEALSAEAVDRLVGRAVAVRPALVAAPAAAEAHGRAGATPAASALG
ncbi:MAG: ROK family protein [Micrococcales bacterium]|nr:ROK family protein [Micrococcales bacterium]